ncbi:MAG: TetR/AcrR family transcriptional regulator [Ruminococcus bromii]|nr:TetR/AcrR family transcriptional regulator [Ruminococcus bromii]MDY4711112.1 TetR/AcrR family transcriptional regulator [Ruminococcus bromii]
MPPKAKFTKDEILNTALSITEESGIDAVTARELGKRLGSSARPIFTVFESMDEIKHSVILKAKELYGKYVETGLKMQPAFKGVGVAYIRFAAEKPKLFQLLFMRASEEQKDVSAILPCIDDNYEKILKSVQEPYCLDSQTAERIYQHLWTYTHGIATMFATGLCNYTAKQIEERLTEVFKGLLLFEKGRNTDD